MTKNNCHERVIINEIGKTLTINDNGNIWRIGVKPRARKYTQVFIDVLHNLHARGLSYNKISRLHGMHRSVVRDIVQDVRQTSPYKKRRAEQKMPNGYLRITITRGRKDFTCGAHRLVWQHFHGDIPKGLQINHKNAIKDDNRLCNLELVTAKGNAQHARANGLITVLRGQDAPGAKLKESQVKEIYKLKKEGTLPQCEIAKLFGVCDGTISMILSGEIWNHLFVKQAENISALKGDGDE